MSSATTIPTPKTGAGTAMDKGGGATAYISTLHPDIIQTHILSRLDYSTLASAAATCSQLNVLASQEDVWANLCRSTWPSTGSPLVRRVIRNFPHGSRSFFSDSYTIPWPISTTHGKPHMNLERTPQLISAVDLYYRQQPILSRVVEMETVSEGFRRKPFRVDILEPKEVVPTPIKFTGVSMNCWPLVQELRLSWIVIDASGKRAVNLFNPNTTTSIKEFYRGTELEVWFQSRMESKGVFCFGWVKFVGENDGGIMQVREARLELLHKNGRESLVILQRALEGKRETKNEWIKRYQRESREIEEMRRKREGWSDGVRRWWDKFLSFLQELIW
ncbi:hypothetical protein K1719_006823 [Acacia pycnantha]|nr:hypothetical protein K1719_006823 [Acacia pycnantha]